MAIVLAADIGGTKLAAGAVRDDGALLASDRRPTPSGTSGEELYQTFLSLLRSVLATAGCTPEQIGAVGIGCGGPMRFPEGYVSPLNIPAWRDFPLRPRLEAEFGRPVLVDNDAKAFALGEHWLGQGRGARCLLAMVVSTGVGGGIVHQDRLVDGATGNAGHIGHVVVLPNGPRCACGARGCLEAVASGPSIARAAREAMARRVPTSIPPDPTGRDVGAAAADGDALARRLLRRAGVALGRGIASAAELLDLDRVVIGGGVSGSAAYFLPSLQHELTRRAQLDFSRGLAVEISSGSVDAALVGAARLGLEAARGPSPGAGRGSTCYQPDP